jgi:hypothetical protein
MLRGYIYLNSLIPLNDIYINKILDINKKISEILSNENEWINSDYSTLNTNTNTNMNYYQFNKLMYIELIFI